jgi:hypothetical protein
VEKRLIIEDIVKIISMGRMVEQSRRKDITPHNAHMRAINVNINHNKEPREGDS